MSAPATRGVALQANLCPKCRERPVCFRSLDLAKKWLEQPEHFLDAEVSFGDPLEIIDLAMALDATAEQPLESQKNSRYDSGRTMLRR